MHAENKFIEQHFRAELHQAEHESSRTHAELVATQVSHSEIASALQISNAEHKTFQDTVTRLHSAESAAASQQQATEQKAKSIVIDLRSELRDAEHAVHVRESHVQEVEVQARKQAQARESHQRSVEAGAAQKHDIIVTAMQLDIDAAKASLTSRPEQCNACPIKDARISTLKQEQDSLNSKLDSTRQELLRAKALIDELTLKIDHANGTLQQFRGEAQNAESARQVKEQGYIHELQQAQQSIVALQKKIKHLENLQNDHASGTSEVHAKQIIELNLKHALDQGVMQGKIQLLTEQLAASYVPTVIKSSQCGSMHDDGFNEDEEDEQ